MEFSKDLYKILGVVRNATPREIKKAYLDLARKHHPDMNHGSKESHKRFVEVGKAYEILSDPEKRSQYDTYGSTADYGFQRYTQNYEEVVRRYKEQFYRESWSSFVSQMDRLTRIIYAGFDPEVEISKKRTHTSKSQILPILQGEKEGSNVIVTSIGDNFHNYFTVYCTNLDYAAFQQV